ncbi:unnamed protein product [Adineta ricciae]|uniref:Uncharacterized protein n=1 Tax=Adineta ricciae TaxID=249248 RepID=A0A815L5D1_ADIRI|nr:unnamed protein product [Adineta ricciae]
MVSDHFTSKVQLKALLCIIVLVSLSYTMARTKFFNLIVSHYVTRLHSIVNSIDEPRMTCKRYFLNYTPSYWEDIWYNNIDEFQKNVCGRLSNADHFNKSVQMMQRLIELQRFGRNKTANADLTVDYLFSRMFYREECRNSNSNVSLRTGDISYLIEPLIGLLRDPFTVCPPIKSTSIPAGLYADANMQSKRFILLLVAAPFHNHSLFTPTEHIFPWSYQHAFDVRRPKLFLFDIGSSYFGSWGGNSNGASSLWFYEYHKRFHVKFDRIIAFEHSSLDAKSAWSQLPDDVFPVYTLINVGVGEAGKFNPWTMLQAIAETHDYVIVKIDIDTPALENALIEQIFKESKISSLIDELCVEHHVTIGEMIPFWGLPGRSLKDSYVLFRKMRQLGIRMHSWP